LLNTIPTRDLKIGMFVADLDRPWLGTPFLIQGFLIEDEAQLAALQAWCQNVMIDRSLSVGEQYRAPVVDDGDSPRDVNASPRIHPSEPECRVEAERFLKIARSFKGRIHTQRHPIVPRLSPVDGRSPLDSELRYSAPIVDDVYRALRETQRAIEAGGSVDVDRVEGLVGEMAAGVERNPDALMWLTRLKRADQYTYDHAVNASVHLMVFARFVGMDANLVRKLGLAGLLQDIGKVQIDYEILAKAGPLDEREFEHVREHVAHTLAMLNRREGFDPEVLSIIAAHHERFDGTGYPRGLKGKGISLGAEMAGLVDTYCAMTRDRVYCAAVSSQRDGGVESATQHPLPRCADRPVPAVHRTLSDRDAGRAQLRRDCRGDSAEPGAAPAAARSRPAGARQVGGALRAYP